MNIKIEENDSAEVKAAKQTLIDLHKSIIDECAKKFKSAEEKSITEQEVEQKMKAAISEIKLKDGDKDVLLFDFVKGMDEAMAKLSAKVEAKIAITDEGYKSFKQAFDEAYKTKETEIKEAVNGNQKAPIFLDVKAAVTIGDGNTIGAATSDSAYSLTFNTGIISAIRKRILTYMSNVSVGSMTGDRAMWIEELDEQGTPIFIAEGASKTQLSVRYEERDKKAKKIAVSAKVTTEMMADLPQLYSYVVNNLVKRLEIVKEDQLFNGNDTGENLKGILSYATPFNGSTLAGLIPAPTVFDVLNAFILQVQKAFGNATGIFIEPGYTAEMISTKTSTNEYTSPLAALFTVDMNGIMRFRGVPLIETTALSGSGSDFVGGDLSAVQVRQRQGLTVQIGLDGNDFTNNVKTIIAEERLVQFVSANDTQVLVKGDFASAKTILSTT